MNVTIRDLDGTVFSRFEARATEEGVKLGEALTQAMEMWMRQKRMKPLAKLSDMKPFSWGSGTEKTSAEVDRILYLTKP